MSDPTPEEHQAQVNASFSALDKLTTAATTDHTVSPSSHIHLPSNHNTSRSFLSSLLPSSILQNYESRFHYGNYVIDRSTGQKSWEDMSIYVRLGMHFLYYGHYQQKLLGTHRVEDLLREQSVKMGASYDEPASKAHIAPFIAEFKLEDSMGEMVKSDPNEYATFNEFFAREIRPEARPVAEPGNELVAVSVADCRLTAFPTVDLATRYWIKGTGFTLERLLGDRALADEFDGGAIVIHRLAPQDYHRWHSPVTGTVEGIRSIGGTYYTVNPQAINESGTLDVFGENRRDVAVIRSQATGARVVVVAVGAMLVGSIKWMPGLDQPGAVTKRGECQGYFQYGGSTVIVLYPRGEIQLDEDLVRNSTQEKCETLMRVGWKIGAKQ